MKELNDKIYFTIQTNFVRKGKMRKLSNNALRIYICLKSHAKWDSGGLCWPGFKTIYIETGISSGERIKESLLELKQHNLIEWEYIQLLYNGSPYGQKRNVYHVYAPELGIKE